MDISLITTGYFVLHSRPGDDDPTRGMYAEPFRAGDPAVCPYCGSWMAPEDWLAPRFAELDQWGSAFADVVDGVFASGFLFTERFCKAYQRAGLSGLADFRPVEVVDVTGPRRKLLPVPTYYWSRAMVDGSRINPEASGVIWDYDRPLWQSNPETRANAERRKENFCPYSAEGVYLMQRVVLEATSLTGSDAFIATNFPGYTIVSRRFRDLIVNGGFLAPRLTPIEAFTLIDKWASL